MSNIKYCKKCLMPSTRPGITFDEFGVCSACLAHEKQDKTDWNKRFNELSKLCDKYRKNNGEYDCLIAVSSGKDSHFQVNFMKNIMKMNVLLVSVTDNFNHTKAGEHNWKNLLEKFDCSAFIYQPKAATQKKLVRHYFELNGKPTTYIDRLIYSLPLHVAKMHNIKLLVYGEDISYTYGGINAKETYSAKEQIANGVANTDELLEKLDYYCTTPKGIDKLEPIYLSYFTPWNSYHNYLIAKSFGFHDLSGEWDRSHHTENFDQIDSIEYLMHPWMKYPKFGHTVCTDYVSKFIRYGRMTRKQGIKIIKQREHKLDKKIIKYFCDYCGYTRKEFFAIIDKHYNTNLFKKTLFGWKRKFKVGG